MASGWTNRGKYRMARGFFQGEDVPTNFYVALVTADNVPDADTNTMSDLTEITAGNGYTSGGYQLDRNTTDFDAITEDDANDRLELQIKDVEWEASGGSIPSGGNDARYAVLTDDEGVVADRDVFAFFDLGEGKSVANGYIFRIQDMELRLVEP